MTFAELQRLNADLCLGSIVWLWVLSVKSGSVGLWHVVSRLEFAPARSRTVVLSDCWHPIPEPQQHHEASSMKLRYLVVSMKGGSANNAKNPTPLILRASPTAPMPASRIRCKFPVSTAEKKG
ncbi:hypothetical protein QR685DRAFT_567722 [Neurospora intermedia]|uniref:Questionable protein n=1 Tax=Neurospora intermedia TaxID=5142 RepID=A0ABR3DQ86_NEUIN